uniref:Methenyltetrahydrofolate synthase domain-containing protein n=1 Tax=Bos indicus x Bos taurus TaxID=30522 RepID=A0A4W2FEX1_BOBOX
MESQNLADFPRPVHHRIPNFKGSYLACQNIRDLEVFARTQELKVDPDKPLEGVRLLALQSKKTLLVPTPRLRTGLFNKITPPPGATKDILRKCATSQGVRNYSTPVGLDSKVLVDLVVVGSVAVSEKGWRIGKGEGYADLEYAMMVSMGAVSQGTPVVTIVHDCQVLPGNRPSRAAIGHGARGLGQGSWASAFFLHRVGCGLPGWMCLVAWQLGLEQDGFGRHHPSIERRGECGWGRIPSSSLTRFCSTRSSTYLKHSSRTTTSLWTISSLQLESSPQGVSAPSQRESHGPRSAVRCWGRCPSSEACATKRSRLGRTSPSGTGPGALRVPPEALGTWPHQNWALCLSALFRLGTSPGMPG